jgi:hypothetical protein
MNNPYHQPLSGVVQRLLGVRTLTLESLSSRNAEVELTGTVDSPSMIVHVVNPGEFAGLLNAGETYPLTLVKGNLDNSEVDSQLIYRVTPFVVVTVRSGDYKYAPDEIELEVDTDYFPQTAEVPNETE